MEQKRKEEIRKSIIACDNDIVKLRSQAENLEEIIKNQKCTQKRFESECDKYEIKRQKKKIKLENMSCLIQNVKLVERYVGRMSDRVSGNCYNVNSNRLLNMMKQMDKEILNNENMLEVHAILQRQRCNENITKKTGTLSDAYFLSLAKPLF